MTGLIVKYEDKIFKVGCPQEGVTLCACVVREEFILNAGGSQACVGIYQKLREGIEFEVGIAEFDEASEPLSEKNQPIIEPGYPVKEDPNWKLKYFRKIEAILKEEGLIE